MKILVYGAGVQGSVFAALLHRAGQNVKILARGQRLADNREQGILLESWAPLNVTITSAPYLTRA